MSQIKVEILLTMSIDSLAEKISPPLDRKLVNTFLKEFAELERRFALNDWGPVALDGGQFAEVASRIIYHIDSGKLSPGKSLDSCLSYVESESNKHSAEHFSRRDALHLCKVLRLIYKFRSQRGAIHIDPHYTANELDSTLILSLSRWVLSDILRIFCKEDRKEVAKSIREIIKYPIPSIFEIDGRALVLHTDCTVHEEILLLLHNSGEAGLSRKEIGKSAIKSASAITESIQRLESSRYRQIIQNAEGKYILTPNGIKRVHGILSEKRVSSSVP